MKFMFKNILAISCFALAVGAVTGCSSKDQSANTGNNDQSAGTDNIANTSSVNVPVGGAALPRAVVAANAQFAVTSETAASLQEMKAVAACSLENVVNMADSSPSPGDKPNSYQVTKGKAYKLIGFATNLDAGTVPQSIRLLLESSQVYALNAVTGLDRPDVGKFFKKPELAAAGYKTDAAFDDVPPGEYSLFIQESDASPLLCPTHQTITVR